VSSRFDLCVVGAGSGGIGAALAASRAGLEVLLLDSADRPGGTSTRGGVHAWEVSAGGTGIPFELYRRLRRIPKAVGITSIRRHCCFKPPLDAFPGGEAVVDPNRKYVDTLQRCGTRGLVRDEKRCRRQLHAVVFEPDALVRVVTKALAETGRCRTRWDSRVVSAETRGGLVVSVRLANGRKITADSWIDASGDVALCRACGCELMQGWDARSRFGESSAPTRRHPDHLNGVTRLYRITPVSKPRIEPLPSGIPEKCWWRDSFPVMSCNQYPNGDMNCNMLPTMEGSEFLSLSPVKALSETERRVRAHWHDLQVRWPEFRRYRLKWIAPAIGVRETSRVVTEYVLREQDITRGLSGQKHRDIVAITDHPCDRHGARGGIHGELAEPYGIPYRCLVPRDFRNLLVACRGAGFSSIAASSCRLSRTMMQIGQAAGTAVSLAKQIGCDLPEVSADLLRASLREQHVQLDWPLPPGLRQYLAADK